MLIQKVKYYEFVKLHTISYPSSSHICFKYISFLVNLANQLLRVFPGQYFTVLIVL